MITVKTYFFNYRVFVDCDRANNVIENIFFFKFTINRYKDR